MVNTYSDDYDTTFFSLLIQPAFEFILDDSVEKFNPCKDDVSCATLPKNRGHSLCISSSLLQGGARKRV
jgi:hypothetical protein